MCTFLRFEGRALRSRAGREGRHREGLSAQSARPGGLREYICLTIYMSNELDNGRSYAKGVRQQSVLSPEVVTVYYATVCGSSSTFPVVAWQSMVRAVRIPVQAELPVQ